MRMRGETVNVSAFGVNEQFSGVTEIYAYTGSDNDQIQLDDGVLAPSELYAGSGTVTLKAGTGAATLAGGSGNDTLTAGPASDVDNTIISGTGQQHHPGRCGQRFHHDRRRWHQSNHRWARQRYRNRQRQ